MSAAPVRYGAAVLAEIAARCEADPEREACGFVVERGGALEVIAIENAADRYHAADPVAFPRTGRESFILDPRAQLRALAALDREGGRLVALWHSHVEAGAHLSAQDREGALVDGAPLLPGAEYLVVGVRAGRAAELRRYRLEAGGFVESPLSSP